MVVGGVALLFVFGIVWSKSGGPFESNVNIPISIGVVILLVVPITLGIAVAMSEPVVDIPFCDRPENKDNPICVDPIKIKWTVFLEADLDVDGSTYPAAPMTILDTAVGGTTSEWTAADGGNMENDDRMATTGYHIDTDLADTEALWAEPNGVFIEIQRIQLTQGPYASGGALENQFYYAKIDSISLTRLPTDNATVQHTVFYMDTEGQHHIGYQTEAGAWIEACPEYRGTELPTTGCGAIPVGQDNGASDTTGSIATNGFRIWWIWEDRGPFAFNDGYGAVWSLVFSIGSEDDWHTYTFIVTMAEDATNNA